VDVADYTYFAVKILEDVKVQSRHKYWCTTGDDSDDEKKRRQPAETATSASGLRDRRAPNRSAEGDIVLHTC
jgi:hypothetical protein